MLRLGGMAAAGAAAAAVATAVNASPADASTGNMQYGAHTDAGSDSTSLESTSVPGTFVVSYTGYPYGFAIDASAYYGSAIRAYTYGPYNPKPSMLAVTNSVGAALECTDNGSGSGGAIVAHCEYRYSDSYVIDASTAGVGGVLKATIKQVESAANVIDATTSGVGGVLNASITNGANGSDVIDASTAGAGAAIAATSTSGSAIYAHIDNASNSSKVVDVKNLGAGTAIDVWDGGVGGGSAIRAHLDNPSNNAEAVFVSTAGFGRALVATTSGFGVALTATVTRTTSAENAALLQTLGTGAGLVALAEGGGTGAYGKSGAPTGISLTGGVIGDSATKVGTAGLSRSSTGVHAQSLTGRALNALTTSATSLSPAAQIASGGRGSAVVATNTANATLPTVKSISASAQPAVQATGKVVPLGGAVAAAGNDAALSVQGVATFTRSNVATVPATAAVVVVNVPGGLGATSHVLATMQTTTASNIGVKSATPDPATGKITITLTAAAPAGGITVAWFVFG